MVAFFPRPGPGRRGLVDSKEGEALGVPFSAKGIKLGRSRDSFGVVAFFPRPGPGRRGFVGSMEGEVLVAMFMTEGNKEGGRLGRSGNAPGVAAFFPRPGMRGPSGIFDATGESEFLTWGGMLPNGVESEGSDGNVDVLLFENLLGGDETPEGLALSKKGASPLGGLGAPTCSQAQPHPENEMSNELADLSNF